MSESSFTAAERITKQRVPLFYLMAIALLVSAWSGVGVIIDDEWRVAAWVLTAAITVVNLTPVVDWLRSRSVSAMLNDESTREHRRNALQAGFWAAIVAASLMSIIWPYSILFGIDIARIVVTAALVAALVSFATQELRAARG